ncbi:MAG: FUSC family membrane protein [Ginsengibacter sp.]
MLKDKAQDFRYFFFSQYLADGVRVTIEILLPAFVFAQFGMLTTGISISLGALCVSIADAPGPVEHKRNGMLYCNLIIFPMALITGLLNHNIFSLGILILLSSFFFTMLTVFGNRANSIGTAALLILILQMSSVSPFVETFRNSLFILGGGVWYMAIALLFYRLTPYRPAQRSLGNCIHDTAKFLRIKSALFATDTDLDAAYRQLVDQQVVVNEKQDAMRELLFKNRELLKESTTVGRKLVITFVDVVDLYERIMANWYDFDVLRKRFGSSGILDGVATIMVGYSEELDRIGQAIQSNSYYTRQYDFTAELENLKNKITASNEEGNSNFILRKVLVNIRKLDGHISDILNYFDERNQAGRKIRTPLEYSRFVSHQQIDATVFKNNLTLESSVFRHSLRMMITCGLGFTISKLISYGHHSYWILLTIVIILKPGFSLTKQRNFERFTGTLIGGIAGILIISFIHDRIALFIIMAFFMIGTYTYVRVKYILMVIFMTPYLLILFNFLGLGILDVAGERLLDTAIASILAFMASYFLFPFWESKQLPGYMASVLKANLDYLQILSDTLCGKKSSSLEYKLVRKELFISTANLAAAFHRMLSEPKSKQRHTREIYEFVVLNHVLSSNIAALTASLPTDNPITYPKEIFQPVKRSATILEQSLHQLDNTYEKKLSNKVTIQQSEITATTDKNLAGQLDFIYKVTSDIGKVTNIIAG